MQSLDFLYYSLGIGFLVLVGFLSYVLYFAAADLKEVKRILENIEQVTDIDFIGNRIKLSIMNYVGRFFDKGGDKRGKKQ